MHYSDHKTWMRNDTKTFPSLRPINLDHDLDCPRKRGMLTRNLHRDFIMSLIDVEDVAAMSAAYQPPMII